VTVNKPQQTFVWPMGDCDSGESLHMSIPLQQVQSQQPTGGNIRILYDDSVGGVKLIREPKAEKPIKRARTD
jgi:hypothetical protein